MRKILIIAILFISNKVYSQKENIEFENLDSHLYKTEIIEVDSINQVDLQKKFKKIASTLFVNLDKVITNETGNQIVLNYILTTKNLPATSWNVRIISQFKDSKMRLQVYDLGNVFIPSGQYTPTWNESSFYVTNNKRATKNRRDQILIEWAQNVNDLIEKFKNELNKPILKDDW